VAGEVTQAVRDTTTDAGFVHVGDWIGLGRQGRALGRRLHCRGRQQTCSRLVTRPEHELLTIIEGDGSTPANTRRITEFLADEFPAAQCRGAPGRPTPLPVLLRHRVSDAAPRRLRQLGDVSVSQLRHVGETSESAALATLGIENVFDLLTFYPRRYIDRTKRVDLSDLTVGDEAAIFAEVKKVTSRTRRGQGKSMVEVTCEPMTEARFKDRLL
jgi:hypothetical protein